MTTPPAPSAENPPPPQQQPYPGTTGDMNPLPADEMRDYTGRGLLEGRRALVTGGDSGIGRAVSVAFAKEGADVAIAYLSGDEDTDAGHTAELVRAAGRRCAAIRGDLAVEDNCEQAVRRTADELGGLDILVNNVATQKPVTTSASFPASSWSARSGSTSSATSGSPARRCSTSPTAAASSTPRPSTACAATRR